MKYDVILADPPWTFSVWNAEKSDRHASHKYALMDVKDICELPVIGIAEENCALFIWATWPNIQDAFAVITKWGFKYRTLAWIWIKTTKNNGLATGMGYYTRANSEPCLLAVKGRMSVAAHDVLAVISSPRREHSQKPDEQYAKIERLYPNKNYLELFARQKRPGWNSWGNEIESDIEL
jgi:N6-adenosine-specific RNA methylase IME4